MRDEREEKKKMNWPDDDFIFQQQKIVFRRVIFFLSFVLYFFFSNFFSLMCTRFSKYKSKRTYEMILDEAARRRQRLFFRFFLLLISKTKLQVKMWRRKRIKVKNFYAYDIHTYIQWPLKCNQCECHRCSFHCKL